VIEILTSSEEVEVSVRVSSWISSVVVPVLIVTLEPAIAAFLAVSIA
jgi:hypothetical protein